MILLRTRLSPHVISTLASFSILLAGACVAPNARTEQLHYVRARTMGYR